MPGALAPPSAYTTCAVEASPTGDGVGALEPFHGSACSAVETPVPNPPAEPTIPTATAPASSRFIVAFLSNPSDPARRRGARTNGTRVPTSHRLKDPQSPPQAARSPPLPARPRRCGDDATGSSCAARPSARGSCPVLPGRRQEGSPRA